MNDFSVKKILTAAAAVMTLTLLSSPSWALDLILNPQNLNPQEQAWAIQLLQQVQQTLPPVISQRLPQTTAQVQFVNLPDNQGGEAHKRTSQIKINKELLQIYFGHSSNQLQAKWSNKPHAPQKLALATLIHEVAHIYDFAAWPSKDLQQQKKFCESVWNQKNDLFYFYSCKKTKRRVFSASTEPEFLLASNWSIDEHGTIIQKNYNSKRLVDTYELTNPQEGFAVNLEHFLLDPEFQCRRPSLYQFYQSHFVHTPFPRSTCNSTVYFYTGAAQPGEPTVTAIDLNRVYQVHYLFAGEGSGIVSGFGHSMFRLVICAPQRQVGPECLQDYSYHKVLSYRASIVAEKMSQWKGLTGKYPSLLFASSLDQIVNEYTVLQFRDLTSHALALTPSQIQLFVRRASEVQWAYRGKYYFLDGNCATESIDLLKSVLPQNPKVQYTNNTRPDTLRNWLIKIQLAQPVDAEKNKRHFIEAGLFFENQKAQLEKIFSKLAASGLTDLDLDAYLETSAAEREQLYQAVQQWPASAARYKTSLALMALENHIYKKHEIQIQQSLMALYLDQPQKLENIVGAEALQQAQNLATESLDQVQKQSIAGYGLLLPKEYEIYKQSQVQAAGQDPKQQKQLAQQLQKSLKDLLGAEFVQDYKATMKHVVEWKILN
ncbi:MAG: DUF4105 domain-containing protein [Pseudobdellovibrionaceae bacterium]